MTNKEVINFLDQVRKILLGDKSWLESTIQPINEAFDMAISAIEKQIPKKPIRNAGRINPVWVEDAYLCPICFSWAGSIGFCSRCGQAIDCTRRASDEM